MSCSIIIPTYNRKQFETLISDNILCQTYYNIIEIIVLDDGTDEPLNLKKINLPIVYLQNMKRCSIGYKRNYGCSIAKGQFIAFMDTDDYYHPNYISKGILSLEMSQKDVSGSADMVIYNLENRKYYKQKCLFITFLNEATLVFRKSYWLENKFNETTFGEAVDFLQDNPHRIIEVEPHMVCIAHGSNTVDKTTWCKDEFIYELQVEYLNEFKINSTDNV